MYAPDAVQGPDGRYYLFYGPGRIPCISAAVCDTPAGKFEYLGDIRFKDGKRLDSSCGFGNPFDPAIYHEGDDFYLYYGFGLRLKEGTKNPGGYVARTEKDMLTLAEDPHMIIPAEPEPDSPFAAHPFLEAPSMRLIQGRYYFIYSSKQGHELC